jgi:hypothetical protein
MEGDRETAEGTCARWNADREELGEGTWSGNVENCEAGDISADGRANALRQYNLYRWLADLPAVETDPERDQMAQECALMMEANESLSHDPPMSWDCWTELGAEGAGSSNISSGPGVNTVPFYMLDNGNEANLGHRRWILSNSLGPIGLGSTATGASCMQNLNGEGRAGKEWLAWPPPGLFPLQAMSEFPGPSLDDTGWSIQSDEIDLEDATVTVTVAGAEQPITLMRLPGGYGSRYALSFTPDGWETEAGETYRVSVAGTSSPIEYEVSVVDCEP